MSGDTQQTQIPLHTKKKHYTQNRFKYTNTQNTNTTQLHTETQDTKLYTEIALHITVKSLITEMIFLGKGYILFKGL